MAVRLANPARVVNPHICRDRMDRVGYPSIRAMSTRKAETLPSLAALIVAERRADHVNRSLLLLYSLVYGVFTPYTLRLGTKDSRRRPLAYRIGPHPPIRRSPTADRTGSLRVSICGEPAFHDTMVRRSGWVGAVGPRFIPTGCACFRQEGERSMVRQCGAAGSSISKGPVRRGLGHFLAKPDQSAATPIAPPPDRT